MKKIINLYVLFFCNFIFSQIDSTKTQNDTINPFSFGGYAELYYSYDFSNPENHEKEGFIYNHRRHNEMNINLALAKASYNTSEIRSNLSLMVGNYAQYNLSSEPSWAQFIYEANIGIKLSKKENLWLDIGIMPSHIGFESAISADCWTPTRSILAENSPYYETGIKLNHTSKNEKWFTAFMVLNGWQRTHRTDNFQLPSIGMQVNYKPNSQWQLNYSNFIGSNQPDSVHAYRVFHNLYAIFQASKKLGFIAGFDLGSDKYNSSDYGIWYSPVLIARYSFNSKSKLAARVEYYNDSKQIIIYTGTTNGFQSLGISANYDREIFKKIVWRNEFKWYLSKDAIFNQNSNHLAFTTSVAIKL